MADERKPAWRTCLIVGCGLALLLAIGTAVAIALNWGTVSKTLSEAGTTISGLLEVQRAVQAHTGAAKVEVHLETNLGEAPPTLRIQVSDSGFLGVLDPADPGARAKAREIAVVARDALPPEIACDRYRIVFTSKVELGLTVSTSQSQDFLASELPPRAAAPEPTPR